MSHARLASWFSAASAALFLILVLLQLGTGAAQHQFEVFQPPDLYAARLLAHAGPLRAVIALDDIFIVAYVGATTLTVLALGGGPVGALVALGGLTAGWLDLTENHHMLALLRAAENAVLPAPADLIHRMTDSSLKWAAGHAAFFLLALRVPGRSPLPRAVRAGCAVQLPIGMAGVVYDRLLWLQLLRAALLLAGFILIAALTARAAREDGSGAPA
jgi:hypothetical protein